LEPERFDVEVDEATLADLGERLRRARIAPDFANEDWRYGVEGGYLAELVAHWRDSYDWRATEREINSFANYRVELDGIPIHFIHERGKGPDPTPLLMTHGWPWTFWDYHKVIRPLTDPAAFGGDPADAFDVVIPSLPGYGFSTPLTVPGVQFTRTTDLWVELMREVLGYDRFAAYGGDWGSLVTADMGHRYAEHLIGLQLGLCFPLDFDLPGEDAYPPEEHDRFEQTEAKMATCVSHMSVQSSDPQTLAYALQDSPVGLLAWILERRRNWSGCEGEVERCFSKDDLITTAMIYWVTESIGTSMRYYWETARNPWQPSHDRTPVVEAKTGILLWPQEVALMPTAHMRRYYNVERLTEMAAGGHFHPMEQPEALVDEVRAFHRQLRGAVDAGLVAARPGT
jgi:pimeloyl-ACP methyl ester carboxylesterase